MLYQNSPKLVRQRVKSLIEMLEREDVLVSSRVALLDWAFHPNRAKISDDWRVQLHFPFLTLSISPRAIRHRSSIMPQILSFRYAGTEFNLKDRRLKTDWPKWLACAPSRPFRNATMLRCSTTRPEVAERRPICKKGEILEEKKWIA
jgi:hypothetical protein